MIPNVKTNKSTHNDKVSPTPSPIPPPETQRATSTTKSFAALGLSPHLQTALRALSITIPTPIQAHCIPPLLRGSSCIGGAHTGSGKTLAFALPILQRLAADPAAVFAVVLTPTRELALQIHEQVLALAAGAAQPVKCALVTGGADMREQALRLARRPHVVVATPGRLADHVRSSGPEAVVGLRRARTVVLDEADRLLASGRGSQLPDVEVCLSALPDRGERQMCLFTATVTPEVRALKDTPRPPDAPPVFVYEVDGQAPLAVPRGLAMAYQLAPVTQREAYLHVLLLTPLHADKSAIVFANRAGTAALLETMLRLLGHRVTALHSGLSQRERTDNLGRFRAAAARILVATDVAARGLDIPTVALVVNYDVPRDPDDFVHRVGRTARRGRSGEAVTMVGQRDVELVLAIEERVGAKMGQFEEEGVSVEGRVVREALGVVGEKRREAALLIEEGKTAGGKKKRRGLRPAGEV